MERASPRLLPCSNSHVHVSAVVPLCCCARLLCLCEHQQWNPHTERVLDGMTAMVCKCFLPFAAL